MLNHENSYEKEHKALLKKHWSDEIVILNLRHFSPWNSCENEKVLPESELLEGEMSANIFRIGHYDVRIAERLYNVVEPGYAPENETPASEFDVELAKNKGIDIMMFNHRLRIVGEVSVRNNFCPDNEYKFICRAAQARNFAWIEKITDILVAKENSFVPDEYASLFVHRSFSGSSFSIDTWYKLAPTGNLSELSLHPFNPNVDKENFR